MFEIIAILIKDGMCKHDRHASLLAHTQCLHQPHQHRRECHGKHVSDRHCSQPSGKCSACDTWPARIQIGPSVRQRLQVRGIFICWNLIIICRKYAWDRSARFSFLTMLDREKLQYPRFHYFLPTNNDDQRLDSNLQLAGHVNPHGLTSRLVRYW